MRKRNAITGVAGRGRRGWLLALAAGLLVSASVGWMWARPARAELAPLAITVYKSPSCGCCQGWIEHLEAEGFAVEVHDTAAMDAVKERLQVPDQLVSCHTATVEGYTAEGHIPADVIRDLVERRPDVLGIGVRGMPIGSPGMEQGGRREPYAVMAFDTLGQTYVFARR